MKLLLYCTKAKPYLTMTTDFVSFKHFDCYNEDLGCLNGKVIAECDFEVEKIIYRETEKNSYSFGTETLTPNELLERSCMTTLELCKYIGSNPNWTKGDYGYAIHIKNLHIFDTPKELSDFAHYIDEEHTSVITKAPQNMMYAYEIDGCFLKRNILISIRPEWLCKILNGEKTIEIRKVVPKGMFYDIKIN